MTEDDALAAISLYEAEFGIPVTDALWFSDDRLVAMVVAAFPSLLPRESLGVH
jgi:uncharacterized NAD-dependent epimerase/dehydratase family protein